MKCPKCKETVPEAQYCDLCGMDLQKVTIISEAPSTESRADTFQKKYKYVRQIGEGGMGIVYEAVDTSIDRPVAIKKMREEIKINPKQKRKFLEEAKRVAKLDHRNIVSILTVEEEPDICIVFEYVDGVTLENRISNEDKIALKEALKIAGQVLDGMEYAHGKGVIHRDLKPANVMIKKDGTVKLMDFGIAAEAHRTIMTVTKTVETSGTLAYMAPEQQLGKFDEKSDIYSFGVMFYEMLTGELPFQGQSLLEQKERMVFTPMTELVPALPAAMDKFFVSLIHEDKEKRFASAGAVRKELEKIKQQ